MRTEEKNGRAQGPEEPKMSFRGTASQANKNSTVLYLYSTLLYSRSGATTAWPQPSDWTIANVPPAQNGTSIAPRLCQSRDLCVHVLL